ncbi:MAG: hypothetical protein HHAS10_06930 [Candidatus Altimarinota bacterium]
MRAVFIFYPFLFYGTYELTIEHACARNLDEILTLRSKTDPKDLKPISPDEIAYRIHEFYTVIMNGATVGCFRIFTPETNPDVLELGSVVSSLRGTGRIIVGYSEEYAQLMKKRMIAITGGKLDSTLEKQGWKVATDTYKKRMQESLDDKKCWEYSKNT